MQAAPVRARAPRGGPDHPADLRRALARVVAKAARPPAAEALQRVAAERAAPAARVEAGAAREPGEAARERAVALQLVAADAASAATATIFA